MRTLIFIIETDNNNSYTEVYQDLQERIISINFYYSIKAIYSENEYNKMVRNNLIEELKEKL